jgi:phage-related protein
MAQVSESTTSLQEAARSLQSQDPRQNEQVSKDTEKTGERNSQNTARQTEDRVVISREAQTENSAARTDERGAAQRLNDLNKTALSGIRNNEGNEGSDSPAQLQNNFEKNLQEANTQRNRTEPKEASEVRDLVKSEASKNKNAEVQLREFQNQDKTELEIGPKKVSQSVDEIKGQRERADAAREIVFTTPSQKIIQEVAPAKAEQVRSQDKIDRSDPTASNSQPSSPASVQTETGQNVDDLI